MDGIGLDQSQVADAINRKYQGMSQRERNQKMAQAQSGGGSQFQSQYSSELAQAQQPTEFWGAGRKLAENQNIQDEGYGILNSVTSNLGGQKYYYGDSDPTSKQGLANLYDKTGYTQYQNQLAQQKQTQAQQAAQIQQQPNYDYIWSNIAQNNSPSSRGGLSGAEQYAKAVEEAKKYASAGFIPGKSNNDWTWNDWIAGSRGNNPVGGGSWRKGTESINYTPKRGYSTSHYITGNEAVKDNLSSLMTVASVIGGVVLPGLGTSWAGLAGDALGNAGMAMPSFSTANLGLSPSVANMANGALSNAGMGGLSSLFQGGNFLTGALRGGVSSLAGSAIGASGLGDALKNTGMSSNVANTITDFAKGSSSGLIGNLFGKNTGQGNLESALVGGVGRSLGGILNSPTNTNAQRNAVYKTTGDLTKLFNKARKGM